MEKKIEIIPELPIGTEFWYFNNNRLQFGLISSYSVRVTSHNGNDESWHKQLFSRWVNKQGVGYFRYFFCYEAKIEEKIELYNIKKIKDKWYLSEVELPIFFNKQEALNSLIK